MAQRAIGPGSFVGASVSATIKALISYTDGNAIILDDLYNQYSIKQEAFQSLSSGFNQITIPSNAAGVFVILPSTNVETMTLKGVTGDTGIAMTRTGWFMLTFHTTPPASFGITNGGAGTVTGTKLLWF